jgi:RHS repeat-associated protein
MYDGAAQHVSLTTMFTGKERDSESGNDYFGARYYASSMGRFLSPDWSAGPTAVPYADLQNPQSLNLYEYVGNNPLTRTDPNGHWCIFGVIGTTCTPPPPPPPPAPAPPPGAVPGTPQNTLINAQDAARADPNLQPVGIPGQPGRKTFCNIATCQIAKNTGTTTDALVNKSGTPNLANTDAETLANSPSWKPVSPEEAQKLANEGVTVVGVISETGHGHIVTVRPELVPGLQDVGKYGPVVNNIGASVGVMNGNKAFRGATPQYYAPTNSQ